MCCICIHWDSIYNTMQYIKWEQPSPVHLMFTIVFQEVTRINHVLSHEHFQYRYKFQVLNSTFVFITISCLTFSFNCWVYRNWFGLRFDRVQTVKLRFRKDLRLDSDSMCLRSPRYLPKQNIKSFLRLRLIDLNINLIKYRCQTFQSLQSG